MKDRNRAAHWFGAHSTAVLGTQPRFRRQREAEPVRSLSRGLDDWLDRGREERAVISPIP